MPIRGEDHHPTLVLNWAMMPIKFGVGALLDVSVGAQPLTEYRGLVL